jgi:protein-S-isoprenylcysteine O-methyltransferase Ste14
MLNLVFMKAFAVIILILAAFVPQHIIRHREKEATGRISPRPVVLFFAITSLAFVFLVIAHTILLFLNIYTDSSFIFSTPIDLPLQIVGAVLMCISLSIAIWGALSLGEFAGDLRLKKGHRVVKTGAYRWVRHPLYSTLIFWCAGNLLFFKSFLFLILIALVPAIYFEARAEEKSLIEAFGEEYESYRATTGMFFPKVFKRGNSDVNSVSSTENPWLDSSGNTGILRLRPNYH